MARSLTAGMVTEVTAESLRPINFLKAEFPGGDLNLWSGIGDKVFAGDTYTGSGDFLSVQAIQETQEVKATGAIFTLSGIPASIISLALNEKYNGRAVTLWLGALTAAGVIVADPYIQFKGLMDVMEVLDAGETATIRLTAETALVTLERPNVRRYTPEDQKVVFPLDEGLDFVPGLPDRQIVFGRASA